MNTHRRPRNVVRPIHDRGENSLVRSVGAGDLRRRAFSSGSGLPQIDREYRL
jgi:hypothetical protein